MKQKITVQLDKYKPRDYQLPLLDALENKNRKRALVIFPRRSGKDITAFNYCIRECLRRIIVCYYIFPTYAQGKRALWDSVTTDGLRIVDYIPEEVIEGKNSQEMKIRFKNGSLFQLVGSDNPDSLRGTNPSLVIFSEYSRQDPMVYSLIISPILRGNGGTAIFLSTPYGKNHFWDLYLMAQKSEDWFCQKLTLYDTKHIPLEDIEKERAEGLISEDMIQQEYFTSFDMGVEGSYYSKYLDKMRLNGQIGVVPWQPGYKVHTAWDLGVRDSTTIIFLQSIGTNIHIIDCYENNKEGLEHYAKVLEQRGYSYGVHIAPFDIMVRELGSGITRIEKARQLGIKFVLAGPTDPKKRVSLEDGIEAVRSSFSKIWIDEKKCAPLLKALENYRQKFDSKHMIYEGHPLHDWSSHFADAMRYLCISLSKLRDGMSAEDLNKAYQDAVYGNQSNMPAVFRDDLPRY